MSHSVGRKKRKNKTGSDLLQEVVTVVWIFYLNTVLQRSWVKKLNDIRIQNLRKMWNLLNWELYFWRKDDSNRWVGGSEICFKREGVHKPKIILTFHNEQIHTHLEIISFNFLTKVPYHFSLIISTVFVF